MISETVSPLAVSPPLSSTPFQLVCEKVKSEKSESKSESIFVFKFFQTFIFCRAYFNLKWYIGMSVYTFFLMGFKVGWSWVSGSEFLKQYR